jgi:glucokinase
VSDGKSAKALRLYLAVDIGGTKMQSSLVDESGTVLARQRVSTPREGGADEVIAALHEAMQRVLAEQGVSAKKLSAIGIAVPGVVDPDAGRVVVTPNMALSGVDLRQQVETVFRVPVALGNDCNLGALGEAWLGAARNADSVVAILVGTGIGSGFVRGGKMWRGAREAAAEIGHIVMQIGGPQCGCGNFGCLEALASRTAIERQIREQIMAGRPSMLHDILQGDLTLIRSNALRKAAEAGDALVVEILSRAAEVLGHACLTVRHLIDPEVIVLGGGVIKACHDFMLPIVERIVGGDRLPGARDGGRVLLSALGDDAVVLGAVALAAECVGRNPFKKKHRVTPAYPTVEFRRAGEIVVGARTYFEDVFIRVDGTVKNRKIADAELAVRQMGVDEMSRICKGGPSAVFIGTGASGGLELTDEARRYLEQRSIEHHQMPTGEAATAYNRCRVRKAALLRVS